MHRGHHVPRVILMAASVATVAVGAAPTEAKDSTSRVCTSTYNDAQDYQRSGHLRQARELLLQCAKPACGAVKAKCASGAAALSSDIAWISPVVTDADGTPLADARIKVDGEPLVDRLDGRAHAVDPGVHEFVIGARVGKWPGQMVTTKQTIMIVQGQRGPITFTLPAATTDAPPAASASTASASATPAAKPEREEPSEAEPTSAQSEPAPAKADPPPASTDTSAKAVSRGSGPSAFTYVLGGVGVAGLGAGALLTYWGMNDNAALSRCSPNCPPSSVDHIRQMYLASDISLGVGAVALGAATWLFFTSRHHESADGGSAIGAATKRAAYSFDVQPTRAGAFASVQGAF